MNDLDRWVDLEGSPPRGVRELLDAMVPPLSADHEAALDRRIQAAIAEDRRREARRRKVTWIAAAMAAALVLVAGVGGGVLVALRSDAPGRVRASAIARQPPPGKLRPKAVTDAPDGGAPR